MRRIQKLLMLATVAFVSCNNDESKPAQNATDTTAKSSVKEENIVYTSDSAQYSGFIVYPEGAGAPKPAVIVVPEWWGLNDYAKSRARQLADLGYVAIAIDMYGNDKQADKP